MLIGIWIALSQTGTGVLTLQAAAQQNSPFLTSVFTALGANPKEVGENGMSALHIAGYFGADQVIPLLVEKGTPINLLDRDGRTALHLAAHEGHVSTVAILMDHQVDPEIKETKGGMTALHFAVAQKHTETVEILLKKGANASPEEKNGHTPLLIADHEELDDIVELLRKTRCALKLILEFSK